MDKLFPTQEIGSLAKPAWRLKEAESIDRSGDTIAEAELWGRKLKIKDYHRLVSMLRKHRQSKKDRVAIFRWAAIYGLSFFERAGLDIFFNGEQWRSEMYEHIISRVHGFEFLGYVKSFDYRYFKKAACVSKPRYSDPIYIDEFLFVRDRAKGQLKVPFTGAYTLAEWTFNEYYERKPAPDSLHFKEKKFSAKRDFLLDLVHNVIRPEIRNLVSSGANWIQIDEPAAAANQSQEEMELFVEAFNETVKGFNCEFSLHNCYSDYDVLARYACELRNCRQISLEFANRDDRQLGTGVRRTGYKDIKSFEDNGFQGNYGLGVVDVHTDFIEPPELVRDRLIHVSNLIGDPRRIYASTDCGLRTRTWKTSFRKLRNMVKGAKLARRALG